MARKNSSLSRSDSKLPDSTFKYNPKIDPSKFFEKDAFSVYPKGNGVPHPLEMIAMFVNEFNTTVGVDLNKQIADVVESKFYQEGGEKAPIYELHLKKSIEKLHTPVVRDEQKKVNLPAAQRIYFYKQACNLLVSQYDDIATKIKRQSDDYDALLKNFDGMQSALRHPLKAGKLATIKQAETVQLVSLKLKLQDALMHLSLLEVKAEEKSDFPTSESISMEKIQSYVDKKLFNDLREANLRSTAIARIESYLSYLASQPVDPAMEPHLVDLEQHRAALVKAMVKLRVSTFAVVSRGDAIMRKNYGEALLREKSKALLEAMAVAAPSLTTKAQEIGRTLAAVSPDTVSRNPDSVLEVYQEWFKGIYSSVLDALSTYPTLLKTVEEDAEEKLNLLTTLQQSRGELWFTTESTERKLVIEDKDEGYDLGVYIEYYEFEGYNILISTNPPPTDKLQENVIYLTVMGTGKERYVIGQTAEDKAPTKLKPKQNNKLLSILDEAKLPLHPFCLLSAQNDTTLEVFTKITEACGFSQAHAKSRRNLNKLTTKGALPTDEFFKDAKLSISDQLLYVNSIIQWFKYNRDFVNKKIKQYRESVLGSLQRSSDALFRIPTEAKSLTWTEIGDLRQPNAYFQALIKECELSDTQAKFWQAVDPFVNLYIAVVCLAGDIKAFMSAHKNKLLDNGTSSIEAAFKFPGLFARIQLFFECLAKLEAEAINLQDYLPKSEELSVKILKMSVTKLITAIQNYNKWLEPKCVNPPQGGRLGFGVFGKDSDALKATCLQLYGHYDKQRLLMLRSKDPKVVKVQALQLQLGRLESSPSTHQSDSKGEQSKVEVEPSKTELPEQTTRKSSQAEQDETGELPISTTTTLSTSFTPPTTDEVESLADPIPAASPTPPPVEDSVPDEFGAPPAAPPLDGEPTSSATSTGSSPETELAPKPIEDQPQQQGTDSGQDKSDLFAQLRERRATLKKTASSVKAPATPSNPLQASIERVRLLRSAIKGSEQSDSEDDTDFNDDVEMSDEAKERQRQKAEARATKKAESQQEMVIVQVKLEETTKTDSVTQELKSDSSASGSTSSHTGDSAVSSASTGVTVSVTSSMVSSTPVPGISSPGQSSAPSVSARRATLTSKMSFPFSPPSATGGQPTTTATTPRPALPPLPNGQGFGSQRFSTFAPASASSTGSSGTSTNSPSPRSTTSGK